MYSQFSVVRKLDHDILIANYHNQRQEVSNAGVNTGIRDSIRDIQISIMSIL